MMNKCCYCGKEATHQFKNGKWCCEDNRNKCPGMRDKNRKGNIGRKDSKQARENKSKSALGKSRYQHPTKIGESDKICEYGCGKKANFIFSSGKFCCSNKWQKCFAEREKNRTRRIEERKDPEFIQKLKNSVSKSWKDPRRLIKNQTSLKKYYKNESKEHKQKRIQKCIESHSSKEYKDLMSIRALEFWKREEYKENRKRSMNLLLEDPEYHKSLSNGIKNWHKNNPDAFKLEKNPMWQGGISYLPYPLTFAKHLKRRIKDRDRWECKNPDCWKISKRLVIHHIDYIKENCNEDNLITLCNSCNNRANKKRAFWSNFYRNILKESENKL